MGCLEMRRIWQGLVPAAALAVALGGGRALGQEGLPGLDELLGLEESGEQGESAAPSVTERELERALEGGSAGDDFAEAVRLMGETAWRLGEAADAGEDTQRLQEEILRKLDKVIERARQNQQSSSSSSSPSSSQQQQQQQPDQQNQSQSNSSSEGENQSESQPPGGGDARPAQGVAADTATWGALPERVREALQQGSSSEFSAVYRRMTEAYYRRLAEEATR